MRLDEVLVLAIRRPRLCFFQESDPDRIFRCLDENPDNVEEAFLPAWEYHRTHEARLRAEEVELFGDDSRFVVETWRSTEGWWAKQILATDWKFEETERP